MSDVDRNQPPQLSSFEQPNPELPDIQDIHRSVLREQHEPSEGQQRVPVILFLLFVGLAMWGGYYLSEFDGNFSSKTYDGPAAVAAVDPTAIQTKTKRKIDPMLLGKRIYNNCATCHQASGQGVPGQYPPLNQSEWVMGDDRILARILLGGLTGPVEVLGKTYNAQMPAWQQLSDAEIAAVLTYIRGSWNNSAAPVAPETIAALRPEAESMAGKYTAELLKSLQLPPREAEAESQAEQEETPADQGATADADQDGIDKPTEHEVVSDELL